MKPTCPAAAPIKHRLLQAAVVAAGLCIGIITLSYSAKAAVPADLSNLHNEYVCDQTTLIVRPTTVEDIQTAVQRYQYVRVNGMGRSWNQPFFCANGSDPSKGITAVNIQTSTLRPLNIQVLEDEDAVWVDAPVITIQLLDYLSNYVTQKAPLGWTLGAFPWYVYQSIGGAVATGTHGSSLAYNSLSDQVLELEMVLANGTLVHLTPDNHPLLFRAARHSVGRLGIVTRLKMRIVKEQPVRRTVHTLSVTQFLQLLDKVQANFTATGVVPDIFNETEWFWHTQRSELYMVTFTRGDSPDVAVRESVLDDFEPESTTLFNTSYLMHKAREAPDCITDKMMLSQSDIAECTRLRSRLPSDTQLTTSNFSRVHDLPLRTDVTYTENGLSTAAYNITRNLLKRTINSPVPDYPLGSNASVLTPGGERSSKKVKRVAADQRVQKFGGSDDNIPGWEAVTWPAPQSKPINVLYGMASSAMPLMDVNRAGAMLIARNGTFEASQAYLHQPATMEVQIKGITYDQYEVSVPVAKVHDCLLGMMKVAYGDDLDSLNATTLATDKGFRSAPLFRVVGQENALLAQTVDGPRFFMNIEDYLYYNRIGGRKSNEAFKKLVGYLRSSPDCGNSGLSGGGGRVHWGKAGWPDPGCWRGDEEYPTTWCDFGCAVQQLDPDNKFVGSAPDRWTWEGVDLKACCTAEGFQAKQPGCVCKVQHARSKESCPPSPYYTYR